MCVGFVKQSISFAGEAMEQVGDGRGWWYPEISDNFSLTLDCEPPYLKRKKQKGGELIISVTSLFIYLFTIRLTWKHIWKTERIFFSYICGRDFKKK